MPNDHFLEDAELYISDREGPFNTPITDGTKYERAGWENAGVLIPEPEFSTDAGRAGITSEFQSGQCLKRFGAPSIQLNDRANFRLYGKVGMRAFGGTPATPVQIVAGVAYRHVAPLKSKTSNKQLPSFNAITRSGGASTLWPGTVVNDFGLSQNVDEDFQITFSLLASGKHRIPHLIGTQQVLTVTATGTITLTGLGKAVVVSENMQGGSRTVTFAVTNAEAPATWAVTARAALANDPEVGDFFIVGGAGASITLTARHTAPNDTTALITLSNDTSTGITTTSSTITTPGDFTLPGPAPFACLDPRPFLEYTDDIGLRALATDCRWKNWSAGLNNNHNVNAARCGGDPKQAPGDFAVTTGPVLGAYFNKSVFTRRTVTAEITYLVGSRVSEWEKMCKSTQLTGLKFGARGALLHEGTGTYEELSIVIPKARFNGVRGDNVDGYAAFRFSFATEFDSATNGARIEVVNGLDGVSVGQIFN
jgi:hypothetical protein